MRPSGDRRERGRRRPRRGAPPFCQDWVPWRGGEAGWPQGSPLALGRDTALGLALGRGRCHHTAPQHHDGPPAPLPHAPLCRRSLWRAPASLMYGARGAGPVMDGSHTSPNAAAPVMCYCNTSLQDGRQDHGSGRCPSSGHLILQLSTFLLSPENSGCVCSGRAGSPPVAPSKGREAAAARFAAGAQTPPHDEQTGSSLRL